MIDLTARRLFVPTSATPLSDLTEEADRVRFAAHVNPAVTVSPDVATIAQYAIEEASRDPGDPHLLREMHEIHVDSTLPVQSWHAGPRRMTPAEHLAKLQAEGPCACGALWAMGVHGPRRVCRDECPHLARACGARPIYATVADLRLVASPGLLDGIEPAQIDALLQEASDYVASLVDGFGESWRRAIVVDRAVANLHRRGHLPAPPA